MAITLNAKGTSVPYFKIGKSGVTLYQGNTDPIGDGYTIRTNDIWFDTFARNLKFRQSNSTWSEMSQVDNISELHDVDLTGLADGYVLRYSSTSGNWEPFAVIGGLSNDWGSIAENGITVDGYTGDVWQLETSTNTLSHVGPVTVNGPLVADTIHASNLYTDADARSAISATGSISYDSTTGVISFTDADSSYATKVGYNLADETDTSSIVLNPGDAVTPATFRGDVINNSGTVIVDVSSTSVTFNGGLMGSVYGSVYDRTGATLIIEDDATPGPIVHANLDGDVTGNVTGNVTGSLNGNVTGRLYGDVHGDVTSPTSLEPIITTGPVRDTLTIHDAHIDKIKAPGTNGATILNTSGATTLSGHNVHLTGSLYGDIGDTLANDPVLTVGTGNNDSQLAVTVASIDELQVNDSFVLPKGTAAQRPSTPTEGMMFFNSTTKKFEGYDGTNWIVFSPDDWGSIS